MVCCLELYLFGLSFMLCLPPCHHLSPSPSSFQCVFPSSDSLTDDGLKTHTGLSCRPATGSLCVRLSVSLFTLLIIMEKNIVTTGFVQPQLIENNYRDGI